MILLILIAAAVCTAVYIYDRQITLGEFVGMFLITTISVMLIYALQFAPIPNSSYFVSGRIVQVKYGPKFVEQYEQSHTYCTGSGDKQTCRTYYTTERATHPEVWIATDSLDRSWKISKDFYEKVRTSFGLPKFIVSNANRCTHGGKRVSGDSHYYVSLNATNSYDYPVSVVRSWHNPIVGTNSLFNVESDIEFAYPESDGYYYNTRLQTAKGLTFTSHDWDVFNTKLYELAGLNANLFTVPSHEDCTAIEAKWTGGGHNEYNICIVGLYNKPDFVKVFGWSSNLYGTQQLESMIMEEGITKDNLDKIGSLMVVTFTNTDFSQFDYIKRVCPLWINILAFIVSIIVCVASYKIFSTNELKK